MLRQIMMLSAEKPSKTNLIVEIKSWSVDRKRSNYLKCMYLYVLTFKIIIINKI